MKKNFKYYAVAWALLFVVFNVVAFAFGLENKAIFWVGYVFIALSFIIQLACAYIAFRPEKNNNVFYNIPIIDISYVGLIVSILVGGICMAIPAIPTVLAVVVCYVILAFVGVSLMKAGAAAGIVGNIDDKIKAQTFFIKSLTVDAEGLVARAQNDEIKAECKKVYEAVRYSDPMSNDALATVEGQITVRFSELSNAVISNDFEAVKALVREVIILVDDRNKKCKLLK